MADFLETAVPEPMVLLGRKLKPLTIGHLLLLERFDCLPTHERDQLVLAILIASHNHDEVLPLFEDRFWDLRMRVWRWRLGKFDWMEKFQLWDDYFQRSMATPCAISKKDSDALSNSATPFLQHLKCTLQAKLGYSPTEVLNTPYSQAIWDYYTFHEMEGSVDIADAEERKRMADWIAENHDNLIKEAVAKSKEKHNGA